MRRWVLPMAVVADLFAHGGTITWVGGDGDWSDAANWQDGNGASVVPAAGDDVVIRSDAALTVTLGAATPALASGSHELQGLPRPFANEVHLDLPKPKPLKKGTIR